MSEELSAMEWARWAIMGDPLKEAPPHLALLSRRVEMAIDLFSLRQEAIQMREGRMLKVEQAQRAALARD